VGYFPQYGDSACALNQSVISIKLMVKALATKLYIPASIIDKAPSADLWSGQTDEAEMGISYKSLDHALYDLTEAKIQTWSDSLPYSQAEFERTKELMRRSAFKRMNPPIPESPC
jgi:NAD+ synthase